MHNCCLRMKLKMRQKKTGLELLQIGSHRLKLAGISEGTREAKKLLAFALSVDYANIDSFLNSFVSSTAVEIYLSFIFERVHRKPVSRIIGKRLFFKNEFLINQHVLDPRPETETLIKHVLEEKFFNLLDLGTGSGCIIISLLKENNKANGMAADISEECLELAKSNAKILKVKNRIIFKKSNWFEKITKKFDLIVSNPPYVSIKDLPKLSVDVKKYDPRIALVGGIDGYESYNTIVGNALKFLKTGGRLVTEVGLGQSKYVSRLFDQCGFVDIKVSKDLSSIDRVVSGRKQS